MKKYILKNALLIVLVSVIFTACQTSKDSVVIIHTKYGEMKAILYEETPKHKENFLKLANANQYDSTIFHRVIKSFMVQGGDINQKPGITEDEKINYTIDAEIEADFWHVKGALAAARQGDQINPERKSSGSQFYIVHGQKFEPGTMTQLSEGRKFQQKQGKVKELLSMKKYADLRAEVIEMQKAQDLEGLQAFMESADTLVAKEFGELETYEYSQAQIEDYVNIGGAPHLDGEYTVFGRVVEGINVVDSIANVLTGGGDKPIQDIFMTVEVEKMSKKKITELYGYEYPETEKQ